MATKTLVTTDDSQALTNKDLTGNGNTFPGAYAVLPSAYTLVSQTAAQQLLNTTTNGALTLQPGVYFFECGFSLTAMSSTSGSFGFALGGTAVFTQSWAAVSDRPALMTDGAPNMSWATAPVVAMQAASTNTQGSATIRGCIIVTTAGTVIPQVSLTVAAAAIVGAGSYFRVQPANSTTSFSGAWT